MGIRNHNQNIFEIPCDVKKGFVFNQNFTYTETTFAGENPENFSFAASFNGEWDNVENGQLKLRRAGQSSVETLNIVFIQNNQRFEVTESPNRRLTYRKVN